MLAAHPQTAQAVVRTWANVGTAWTTAANWGGTAPVTGDDALFNLASYSFQPDFGANAVLGMFRSSGTGAITFTGTNTLTLNANGSTAGTGILVDSGAGAVNFAGVKFILGLSQNWTNNSNNLVTANGTINAGGNTLTLVGSGSGGFYLGGIISGNNGTALNINRAVTLGAANNYTGTTSVNTGGTLILDTNGQAGAVANSALSLNGGALQTTSTSTKTIANRAYINQNTTISGTQSITFSGNINNRGGNNILTNSISGGGKTLTMSGNVGLLHSGGGATFTLAGSGTTNITGVIVDNIADGLGGAVSGAGGANNLLVTGGVVNLSNANIFGGTTKVSGGKIVMTNALALQNSAYDTTGSNGSTIGLDVTSGLSGSSLKLGGLAGAVNLAGAFTAGFTGTVTSLTLNPQTANSYTYSGAIANGSMSLTKTGAGTQVLSGTNTYTGVTTLNAGTLNLGSAENAGTSGPLGNSVASNPGSIVMGGGTLQYSASNNNDYSGRFSTAAGQAYNVDTNGRDVTWATPLTSSGGTLTKSGAGTLTLNTINTYTGATNVNSGTLNLNGSLAGTLALPAASTGTVTVGSGAKVASADFSFGVGTANATNALAITNQLKMPSGITATLSGGTSFTAAGANLANNSTARTLTLSGGTLTFAVSGTPTAIASGITATASSSYIVNSDNRSPINTVNLSGMTGTFPNGTASNLANSTNQTMWLSNNTTGSGTWIAYDLGTSSTVSAIRVWNYNEATVTGRGVKTLNLQTSTDGITWANASGLTSTVDWTAIGANGTITGTVQGTGAAGYAGFDWTLPTALNTRYIRFNNTQQFNSGGGAYTGISEVAFFQPAVTTVNLPATSVAATASSLLDLAVSAGAHNLASLNLTAGGTTTALSLKNGATLTLSGDANNNAISATGTAGQTASILPDATSPPSLIIAAGKNVSVDSGVTLTVQSIISGSSAVTKIGTGTLTLSGSSTYTGVTTISSGVMAVAALTNGGTASSIGQSTNAASNLVFGAPTATLRYNGSSNATTNRGFTLSSGAGGGATIESSGSGTLTIDNTVALAYGTTNETRLLTLGGTNTGANTFSKVIANNGSSATSLTKAGVGKWFISSTNTYTGATNVNAGTLAITGSGSINASSGVNVAAGANFVYNSSTTMTNSISLSGAGTSSRAILGGAGTIGATVTLNDLGDTLSPGNSPGIQTFT